MNPCPRCTTPYYIVRWLDFGLWNERRFTSMQEAKDFAKRQVTDAGRVVRVLGDDERCVLRLPRLNKGS